MSSRGEIDLALACRAEPEEQGRGTPAATWSNTSQLLAVIENELGAIQIQISRV